MKKDNKYEPVMPEYLKKNLGLDQPRKSQRTSNGNVKTRAGAKAKGNVKSKANPNSNSNPKSKSIAKSSSSAKPKPSAKKASTSAKKAKTPLATNQRTQKKASVTSSTKQSIAKNSSKKIKNSGSKNSNYRNPYVGKGSKNDIDGIYSRNKRAELNSTKKSNGKAQNVKTASVKKPKKAKKRKKRGTNLLYPVIYFISIFLGFVFAGGDKERYISKSRKDALDFKFFRVLSVGFVVLLFVVMFLNIITPTSKTSVAENRELQQRPSMSLSRLLDGKFASEYTKFLSDQFINRDGLIKIKAKFDLMTGKKEINGVYIAKNDYLMEGFKRSDDNSTLSKLSEINKFTNNNTGLKVSMMLVPNKVEIYSNLLPKSNPNDSQKEYVNFVKKNLDSKIKVVELFDVFEKNKNNIDLYFKTDHHWTTDGAYLAYVEYCKALNLEPINENMLERNLASDSFKGSLYYKNGAEIGFPDELYLYLNKNEDKPVLVKYYDDLKKVPSLYDVSKLQGRDPYEVFTGGNHTQIKIRTNIDTKRKLLVVKDSYANAMLPFLVNNFSEITVVDLRYFTGSLQDVIQNNELTDVLFLNNINTFNTDSSILSVND
ncbi:DHHW family protein [Peptostreptococcus porci]|uniref:DHHW family protein n=1 Tax=Peptostreptococcus porci TaxID=2652282 RepID=UPI002A7F0EC6|nr:DHHW family protein [Peptostreptococcus porci]MDY4127870.1 DHHW family protein [Peptostreptococcus porci]MDY5964548.1 DHHW family protein [Peptostreptococcus porci]